MLLLIRCFVLIKDHASRNEAIPQGENMKFGKSLRNKISATVPQWESEFLSYKDLKKQLNLMNHARDEEGFKKLFEYELEKINEFFLRKEEECIITFKELKDEVADLDKCGYTAQITRDLLKFHNEMVLLLHYRVLNFDGLLKIIKKHKKKTGTSLSLQFMQRDIQQPFFTTDLLNKLLEECEEMLRQLVHRQHSSLT